MDFIVCAANIVNQDVTNPWYLQIKENLNAYFFLKKFYLAETRKIKIILGTYACQGNFGE